MDGVTIQKRFMHKRSSPIFRVLRRPQLILIYRQHWLYCYSNFGCTIVAAKLATEMFQDQWEQEPGRVKLQAFCVEA